ncbi:MAG: PAS domain-containing protein, partial [Planctomycetia bacterium]|nr:PAS domain-containing protein [Planctomycetia bacterium]
MSKHIIKRIVSFVYMVTLIWGQNAGYTTNKQSWYESSGMTVTIFILFFIVAIYTTYLYYLKQKLSVERDQLTKLSIDLKSEVVKKDSQFKETSLALQIINDNTFDAIIILNNIGRIIFWNSAAEQLFGYSSEEVIDSDLIDVIIPKEKVA